MCKRNILLNSDNNKNKISCSANFIPTGDIRAGYNPMWHIGVDLKITQTNNILFDYAQAEIFNGPNNPFIYFGAIITEQGLANDLKSETISIANGNIEFFCKEILEFKVLLEAQEYSFNWITGDLPYINCAIYENESNNMIYEHMLKARDSGYRVYVKMNFLLK